jgi:SLOG cluster3 family
VIDMQPDHDLDGRAVFLSASIPDPVRWAGEFDPLEITDAVVAIGRAVLSAGALLVTAAHPTIAPLLLYIAAELPPTEAPRVLVYQSAVFDAILPEATLRFEAEGVGRLIRTEAAAGEPPDPAQAPESLAIMRRQMLTEAQPSAAIFIGGMAGISAEHALFHELLPDKPTYPVGFPGGEARALAEESDSRLRSLLIEGTIYPTLGRAIVSDIVRHRF